MTFEETDGDAASAWDIHAAPVTSRSEAVTFCSVADAESYCYPSK